MGGEARAEACRGAGSDSMSRSNTTVPGRLKVAAAIEAHNNAYGYYPTLSDLVKFFSSDNAVNAPGIACKLCQSGFAARTGRGAASRLSLTEKGIGLVTS